MPLQPIASPRLYRQIADQVRALVVSGEFAVGTRLPTERELSESLGASRPCVREALIALEVEGWIEVRKGRGIYVRDRQSSPARTAMLSVAPAATAEWGPLEVMGARRLLEGEIAALAAHAAQPRDLDALHAANASMRDEVARGQTPLQGDQAFHLALARCSGNGVLVDTVQAYWDARRQPMFQRLGAYFETPTLALSAIAEHEAICAAIDARDAAAAREAMHQHLDQSAARLSAGWESARLAEGSTATDRPHHKETQP